MLEGFTEKPKQPKRDSGGFNREGTGDDFSEKKTAKREPLLGGKAQMNYGIVFKKVRYRKMVYRRKNRLMFSVLLPL